MINTNNEKIREIIQIIHESMLRNVKRGGQIKEEIVMENRIFAFICHDPELGPTKCAVEMNRKYGYDLSADEVIQIFRSRRMANPEERRELFQWAERVADCFSGAAAGRRDAYDKFEKIRKAVAVKGGKWHKSQERIAAIMIYERFPEIDLFDDTDRLHLLGNTLAKYFFYDMSDAVSEVYGFPQYRDKKAQAANKPESKMTYEQAMRRIEQLEKNLERTNTLLQDLQDEFEEQLEANKVKELADFFARLNSEKYGCILDELLVLRKGVDQLRKSDFELPIEINGLLIMVRKLIQFVRDSHIDPIMKIDSIREVTASDVEFCNYEGTPFTSENEKKTVRVVSPGWIYKDKELQISRPKVKEEY